MESIQTVLNQVEPLKARISRPQNDLLCAAYVDGVYYRTTIEIVFFNDTARVRLVDFGRVAVVKWSNLSVLEQCMARFPPFAIQCTLSGNLSNYDEAVTERFKEICHRSQCFSVIVKEIIEDCATVTLLAGRNTVDMCSIEYDLRGFIANRNGLSGEYGEQNWDPDVVLQSEGEETFGRDADCMSDAHSPNTKRRIKSRTPSPDISPQSINKPLATLFNRIKSSQRISVILSHWESPAEFYICLKKNEKSMKTLQRQVNESCCKFKDDNPTRRKMWKEENMCCVETSLTGCSKQWYRGQIRKIIKTNFTVFLIDVGTTIRVDSKQICPIKQQIEIVKANAIKCEMANVICPKAEWDSKSNKKIEAIIRGFKDLAASIQIITKGAALPVILWGCTRHFNALAQDQEDWTNLNERISLEDLALLMGDFVPVDDTKTCKSFFDIGQSASFDLVLNTPDDTDEDWTCCFLEPVQYAMNYNVDIVPAWLPSQSLSKSIFNCFVTYVDRHCRIYVLDEYRRWLTRKIKKEINSRVPKESNEPIYTDWVPGQACFAKFKLDHLYYRAEVVRVNRHRQECNVGLPRLIVNCGATINKFIMINIFRFVS